MKWDKIKNFLIVILLVVDVFFAVTLFVQYKSRNYVPGVDLSRLAQLVSDTIEIPPGVLPAKRQAGIIYGGSYHDDYFESVASLLSGGQMASSYVTPDGMSFVAGGGEMDTYEFTYPFGFRYIHGGAQGAYEIEPEAITQLPEAGFFTSISIKNIIKKFLYADGALNGSGVPSGLRIKLQFGDVRYDASRGLYFSKVAQYVGGQPIYGCEAVVAVKDSAVVYVSGNLILCNLDESRAMDVLDQVNLMLLEHRELGGFADASPSFADGALLAGQNIAETAGQNAISGNEGGEGAGEPADTAETSEYGAAQSGKSRHVLTSAESCLCIAWYANRSKFYLLPGWKFVYDGSAVRVRNSLSGDIYTK
ncbi:MAG TPA: hypothetical protein GXX22_02630 [Clostridiales bacterium]|nr:hypothetical protein [Clostridiales bacterium]